MMLCRNDFKKILVANRGEIAVRILRTAHGLGYRTVAVFSEADDNAPHVLQADEAVCIGAAPVGESYLSIDRVLEAARTAGADAIHPGYGFLSENAEFARACEAEGIIFIGPKASAIELMGCKRRSKIAMLDAGVPCIPGYEGDDQSDERLQEEALAIGFPVMFKASAGGGGRGMRRVEGEQGLISAIQSARSEALSAFGNGDLIVEKALSGARHIEIQVFADTHGNVIHLGERDCSVQRRHQKVVEEAPSPAVSEALRQRMGQAATQAAAACQYVGAGTVEFLLDETGHFYFLEMNTRLQVEHPVTELVTGLDLVAMQLQVASGEPLPLSQDEVTLTGHAMEVRLYAEDPANGFMPQTGQVLLWEPASAEGIESGFRVDSGLAEGQDITAFYDPMLAKLITRGSSREQARRRLVRLVEDSHLLGIRDNRAFLSEVLRDPSFIEGQATTDFMGKAFSDNPTLTAQRVDQEELALAASLFTRDFLDQPLVGSGQLMDSRMSANPCMVGGRPLKLKVADREHWLRVNYSHDGDIRVESTSDGWSHEISLLDCTEKRVRYGCQGVIKARAFVLDIRDKSLWLSSPNGNLQISDQTLISVRQKVEVSDQILASMDGVVVETYVSEGDRVRVGEPVAVIEAMKMEHPLTAPMDGRVTGVLVQPGDQIRGRQLMVQLEALADGE